MPLTDDEIAIYADYYAFFVTGPGKDMLQAVKDSALQITTTSERMMFLINHVSSISSGPVDVAANEIDMDWKGTGVPNIVQWDQWEPIVLNLSGFDYENLSVSLIKQVCQLDFSVDLAKPVSLFWKPLFIEVRKACNNEFPNQTALKGYLNHLFAFHKLLIELVSSNWYKGNWSCFCGYQ